MKYPQDAQSFSWCFPGSVQGPLEDCWSFLRRHARLLSSWPTLCIQQALNEPAQSSAHSWAQGLVVEGGVRVIQMQNNDFSLLQEPR